MAVADVCALCERHVGTESGGMDQAISIMGQPGVALNINFHPLCATPVPLPDKDVAFVIANSLAVSNKAETAAFCYNLRVVECRLATALLARALAGNDADIMTKYTILRDLEPLVDGVDVLTVLAEEARRVLHAGRYPQAEVEALLGVKVEDLLADMPNQLISLPAAASLGGFALQSRAVHVFEEAQRVRRFVEMARADGGADPAQLGDLMNASHTSCRDNYECSSEELDRLVTLARGFGALGARLTGAGWGGCVVAMVRRGTEKEFMAKMEETYYRPRADFNQLDIGTVLFATTASRGGEVIVPDR